MLLGGVLPTPAAPLLSSGTDSTSPPSSPPRTTRTRTNGIKFFGSDRFKLSDETERAIEARMATPVQRAAVADRQRSTRSTDAARTTCARSRSRFADLDLGDATVVLDCANGATYGSRREIFRRLGATLTALAERRTGATSTRTAARRIRSAVAGCARALTTSAFAFDGDGDRCSADDRAARSSTATS